MGRISKGFDHSNLLLRAEFHRAILRQMIVVAGSLFQVHRRGAILYTVRAV